MTTLTREACEALKTLGYPQDGWPQMVWYRRHSLRLAIGWLEWRRDHFTQTEYNSPHISGQLDQPFPAEWVAAPDALTALMWLEDNGIIEMWWRDPTLTADGPWGAQLPGRVDPDDDDSDSPGVRADDPSALIIAIAAHKAAQEVEAL